MTHDGRGQGLGNAARHLGIERQLRDPAADAHGLAQQVFQSGFEEQRGEPPVGRDLARWAVLNCYRMRDRFVLPDLRAALGTWTATDVDRLFERAAALGAGL